MGQEYALPEQGRPADDYLIALGEAMVAASRLEWSVWASVVPFLRGLDDPSVRKILERGVEFQRLLDALKSLTEQHSILPAEEIHRILKKAREAYTARNEAFHSLWGAHVGMPESVVRIRIHKKPEELISQHSMSLADIRGLTGQLLDAVAEIGQIQEAVHRRWE